VSRYTKQHYGDVARLLKDYALPVSLINRFADLFAADNTKRCSFHGDHDTGYSEDCKITGFDREQFLTACGLEPARPHSTPTFRPVGEPGTGKTTGEEG